MCLRRHAAAAAADTRTGDSFSWDQIVSSLGVISGLASKMKVTVITHCAREVPETPLSCLLSSSRQARAVLSKMEGEK